MRRLLCLVLVPLIAGVLAFAVSRAWLGHFRSGPIIVFPATLDLGTREIGDLAVARFTIANRGDSPLLINDIRTNCSCTGIERERDDEFRRVEALQIRPGENADV